MYLCAACFVQPDVARRAPCSSRLSPRKRLLVTQRSSSSKRKTERCDIKLMGVGPQAARAIFWALAADTPYAEYTRCIAYHRQVIENADPSHLLIAWCTSLKKTDAPRRLRVVASK